MSFSDHPNVGKLIIVKTNRGATYRGIVYSAINWNEREQREDPSRPSNWDVEFVHDAKSSGRTGDPGRLTEDFDRKHSGVVSVEFVDVEGGK